MRFTAASFLVTEDCNLQCKYCFESHNKNYMSIDTAKAGLEFLCNNAVENKTGFNAMIFGGEPLLNVDVVEAILDYGTELSKKHRVPFSASMVTNCTIFNTRIKNIFTKYKDIISVQLSIDGTPEVNDMYRLTPKGKGSYSMIAKNIPKWKEVFKDSPQRLNIHGCCNRQSLPYLFDSFKFFREEWGVKNLWFMPIHSEEWNIEDVDIYKENLYKIANYNLEETKKSGDIYDTMSYAPIDKCVFNRFPGAPCGAGKNFCSIAANGDLYACHQFYFNDRDKSTSFGSVHDVGNINLDRLSIFENYDSGDLSCKKIDPDCKAYGCYICIGDNYNENGSILSNAGGCGPRCKMSKVEREIQDYVLEELKNMGLMNPNQQQNNAPGNNPNNPDCLCDSRGIVVQQSENGHQCNCGNKQNNEFDNVVLQALAAIIDKVENIDDIMKTLRSIEKRQELILAEIDRLKK